MSYYLRKVGGLGLTLFLVSIVTFAVFQILPGNPATVILGVDADPLQVEALSKQMGLDKPVALRYISWVQGLLGGSLGTSIRYQQPVSKLLFAGFEVTASLAVMALLLTLAIGIPLGIFIALFPKNPLGVFISTSSQLALSVPSFCIGILLIGIFSVQLKWFPSIGYTPVSMGFFQSIKGLFLPALSIAFGASIVVMRYVSVSIKQQKKQEYVKTARSKGIPEYNILTRHVFRNSLIPVVTILGMLAADILGGSIIVENVFSLPGIGKLVSGSIATRDFPLIQGLVLYLALIVVVCNFLVDIFYSVIDPRIRLK